MFLSSNLMFSGTDLKWGQAKEKEIQRRIFAGK